MTPEEAYPFWRFEMWIKGHGSYVDIEKQIDEGKLIPFKKYPKKELANKLLEPTSKNSGGSV